MRQRQVKMSNTESGCYTYTRSISIIKSCYEWFLFDLNSTPNSYYFTKGTCNLVL